MPVVFSCAIKYFYSATCMMHFRSPELPGTVLRLRKGACAGCPMQAARTAIYATVHDPPAPPPPIFISRAWCPEALLCVMWGYICYF